MKNRLKLSQIRDYLPMSWRSWAIFFVTMGTASVICLLLQNVSTSDFHVPMIFVLAVLIISLLTKGYFYGLLAALTSVITVNFAFTYPYYKLDFSVYGYPLTFITMLMVGFVGSTLTSRAKEQERLRTESEKAKVRANLLRAISHDLRTPLTSISGSLAAVLDNGGSLTDEEKEELLRDAWNDADWLNRMVENLLSVTRISDDGDNHLETQEELLEEVISEAVVNFRKRSSDVEISVSVPEEPLFVPMDAILIEQVLLNLMDNAVLHGRDTSRIEIKAGTSGEQAVITVEDNGGGIPESRIATLFEGMMPRSRTAQSDRSRGMGIGLTVCRTIVHVHGGTIFAENTDEGARFTFTLPLEKTDNYGCER